jgi:FtsP/CotA-like multicopper oxidase with cupredoxin domain
MPARLLLARMGGLALLGALVSTPAPRASPPRVAVNDNRTPAGTLRNGVLTLRLEVREGEWHPDRDTDPGLVVHAFAEAGKPPAIPGPLIRVPEGTEIHATLHNALGDSAVYLHGFSARGASDSIARIRLDPGETREVHFAAGPAGTYYYWGATRPGGLTERGASDAELAGGFVIDPAGSRDLSRDRVLVLAVWNREARPGGIVQRGDLTRFTINGKAWPSTERLAYSAGDTLRFRVINASDEPHPMHLHGFYYRVESRGDGRRDLRYDPAAPPQMVVTERVAPGRTYSMAWVPERAGYWLFHCHNNFHVMRSRPLDDSPLAPEYRMHPRNHALELMGGLTMGIEVLPGRAAPTAEPVARRRLRLIAQVDSAAAGTEAEPGYRYVLEEGARTTAASPALPGPLILLKRGEPVSITVVNQLPEATAVHWHGIELDSYMDGVAGFSGHPGRIAPVIAPRDSFEARFTPPRAGTFIYHPHADEVRQQQAGLSGPLLVVDDPAAFDPAHDLVLLISSPRNEADEGDKVLLNGSFTPAPLELRVRDRYRVRVIDIHTFRPSMILRLERDSLPLTWRVLAKDGMDLPAERRVVVPAVQQLGNGETYDFELTPREPGDFRVRVSSGAGQLLAAMAVLVR